MKPQKSPWYANIPPPLIMLFAILVFVAVLTYLLPAGHYERAEVAGRMRVIPGSYKTVDSTPIGFLQLFRAFPEGYRVATPIIFICLASALMFSVLDETKTIENAVGRLLHRLGTKRAELILVLLTFFYGLLGIMVGYENNIAMIPIAAVVVLALGGDLVLAAGVSAGGMTVAFGLSPINPYTVGIGHEIAELPLFSGAGLRSVLCFGALAITAAFNVRYYRKILRDPSASVGQGLDERGLALSKPLAEYALSGRDWLLLGIFLAGLGWVLFGVFNYQWFINDISAIFLIVFVATAFCSGLSLSRISAAGMRGVAEMAPATFIIGMAATVKVLLEEGQIQDTISYGLALSLEGLPTYLSAIGMSIGQSGLNLLIPSGSGQALATLPVMIPLGEALGLTRQVSILAFQVGDGVTNLFNPSLGGLVAMLSLCRVPFDRWLRFVLPLVGVILVWAWLGLLVAVAIGYV
ncbi:YfcC family protein [Neolewinella antarctica]|uniref:Ion transporter superfamily protein YfcC n=1 Tax=Neolewinella antarctica TaxID=442734 RepID=A0ABX0X979_9BACT|nr:AbgT family transporter [Neolewinella antarctica]NJC25815.1 putative ion transporter superfamily protein YfcC [Neolewinella antarctica]